jgi:hypothetical protein
MTTDTDATIKARDIAGELWEAAIRCDFDAFKIEVANALAPTPSAQEEAVRVGLTDRLIAAIEGECDGLSITDEQASNILAYLQYGAPMDDVRRDAERYRKLRSADINAVHEGGVFAGLTPDNVVINGEDLDIAVDLLIDDPAASAGDQEVDDGR